MGPETKRVDASEVQIGDKIARRNTCGGFVEWMRVTARFDEHHCIGVDGERTVVAIPGERVEIAGDRS